MLKLQACSQTYPCIIEEVNTIAQTKQLNIKKSLQNIIAGTVITMAGLGLAGCAPIPILVIENKPEQQTIPEFIPESGQQLLMSTRIVSQDSYDNNIVCVVKLTEDHYDIFTLNKDGSDLKRLTFNGEGEDWWGGGGPRWIFNGTKIFYTYDGKFYIMNQDGTDVRSFDCDGTMNVEITSGRDKIIFPYREAIYVVDSTLVSRKLYEIPKEYKGFGILEIQLVNDKILFCLSKIGTFSARYKYFSLDLNGNIEEIDENSYKSVVKNSHATLKGI